RRLRAAGRHDGRPGGGEACRACGARPHRRAARRGAGRAAPCGPTGGRLPGGDRRPLDGRRRGGARAGHRGRCRPPPPRLDVEPLRGDGLDDRPPAAAPRRAGSVAAGDDAFLHRAAQESIRLAQPSIMLRAVLTPSEVDDGTQAYRVEPDVVLATMLPLTNTSAAPGLERYDPERWVGRRLRDEAVLPAKELVATFGHGRHACPAQRFSLSAIVRAVRRLVDAYELEGRVAAVQPYREQLGGGARAAEPCPVAYRRRWGGAGARAGGRAGGGG